MNRYNRVLPSGFRIAVTTAGQSHWPALVLLHGLTVSAKAYEELIEELAGHHFYVIAPDAPNHGDSGSLPWGHTIADIAEILGETLDALDIEHAVVVGHSMGGGLAVEFAASNPERVDAVVLLDAAAGKEHHEGIAIAPGRSIPRRAARFAVGGLIDVLGDGCAAMRMRSGSERLSLLSMLKDSVNGLRFVRTAYALMRADTLPLLEAIREHGIPTGVIHGELDQIIPFEAGWSAAEATGGTLYKIMGGFHSWMLADPEFGAWAIKDILRKVTA
ncbi:esterase/lipase [Mycobacterium phage DroogsArmy]|uniref:Esterase n=1 Tax=Mycobacterium phage DroogsArmy TaxID=2744011 RepID=A0A6N0A5N0_9CAUD|nr:esterase/lipase [Mycobacterium phage DroogsArmy]QKO02453.1 esterase [Mycobacterium phage DroogsArmy]